MVTKQTTTEQQHKSIASECRRILNLGESSDIEFTPFKGDLTGGSKLHHTVRILSNQRTIALATIGADLSDLSERHSLIAEELPELTIKLYGFFNAGDIECLLTEYFEGENLEKALGSGSVSRELAKTHILKIADAFAATSIDSSEEALLQEIEERFAAIRNCRVFNETDRKFLEDIIFPLLRPDLENTPLETYLTNGDFIARNILCSPSKGVKLIDYEFAKRTHFKWEDAERWKRFSILEDHELRYLFEMGEGISPLKEIFFLLSQITLDSDKMNPTVQRSILRGQIERIIELTSNLQPALGKSVFLNTSLATAHLEHDRKTTCQLFWDEGGQFKERNSQIEYFPFNGQVTKSFTFEVEKGNSLTVRFDPCTASGLIEIRKVRITDENQNILYEAGNSSGWEGVTTGGNAIALSYESQLLVLSTGPDPYIVFPKIALPSGSAGKKVRAHFEFAVKSSIEQSHKHLGKFAQYTKDLQKTGLLSELDKLKKQVETTEQALRLAQAESASHKQQVAHWQHAIKHAESKLQASIDEGNALSAQLEKEKNSRDEAEKRLALSLEANNRADQTIAAQEAEIKRITDELERIKQLLEAETLESASLKSQLAVEREKSAQIEKLANHHVQLCNRREQDAERDAKLWSNALKRLDLRLERERSKHESQTIQYQEEIEKLKSQLNAVVRTTGRKGENALLAAQGKAQPSVFQRLFHTHADNE